MTLEPETYVAPSAWAPYLINGDDSGLDPSDIAEADAFVRKVGAGAPVSCEDAGWRSYPDFGMPSDCQRYTFLRTTTDGRL